LAWLIALAILVICIGHSEGATHLASPIRPILVPNRLGEPLPIDRKARLTEAGEGLKWSGSVAMNGIGQAEIDALTGSQH
jgi:hypothetical protein